MTIEKRPLSLTINGKKIEHEAVPVGALVHEADNRQIRVFDVWLQA